MDKLGWRGPLAPYSVCSLDGWAIGASMSEPQVTGLPLPLKFQRSTAPGHDNAIVGLAKIDKVWNQDGQLWGEGEFDGADPEAVLLAHKVKHGYVGQVSVDLGDCTITRRTIEGRTVNFVEGWTLMSATICADPKFAAARIAAAELEKAAAGEQGQHALAASVSATFCFRASTSAGLTVIGDPDAQAAAIDVETAVVEAKGDALSAGHARVCKALRRVKASQARARITSGV